MLMPSPKLILNKLNLKLAPLENLDPSLMPLVFCSSLRRYKPNTPNETLNETYS